MREAEQYGRRNRGGPVPRAWNIGVFHPVIHHYIKDPKFYLPSLHACLPNAVPASSSLHPERVPAQLSSLLEEGIRLKKENTDSKTPRSWVSPTSKVAPSLSLW